MTLIKVDEMLEFLQFPLNPEINWSENTIETVTEIYQNSRFLPWMDKPVKVKIWLKKKKRSIQKR